MVHDPKKLPRIMGAVLILVLFLPLAVEGVTSSEITLYELFSLAVSTLGIGGIAFYLIYSSQTFRQDIEKRYYDRQLDLDKRFVEYPEMRPYFYYGKYLVEGDKNQDRVFAVCEMVLDTFEDALSHSEETVKDMEVAYDRLKSRSPTVTRVPFHTTGTVQYIMDMFSCSPVLCSYLDAKGVWFGSSLTKLKELARANDSGVALVVTEPSSASKPVGAPRRPERFDPVAGPGANRGGP